MDQQVVTVVLVAGVPKQPDPGYENGERQHKLAYDGETKQSRQAAQAGRIAQDLRPLLSRSVLTQPPLVDPGSSLNESFQSR